jgi:hypothetical protein
MQLPLTRSLAQWVVSLLKSTRARAALKVRNASFGDFSPLLQGVDETMHATFCSFHESKDEEMKK